MTKISKLYRNLLEISTTEFTTIIESGEILLSQSGEPWKMRLHLCDRSIIDVYYSTQGKYSYHWDRRIAEGVIFRHDNAPHPKWKNIPTFPKHFHSGSENTVTSSELPDNPEDALKVFLQFVIKYIASSK